MLTFQILLGTWLQVVLPVLVWLIFSELLRRRFRNTQLAFERDYPTFLISVSSMVKAGLDPVAALQQSAGLFDSSGSLRQELQALLGEFDKGVVPVKAIATFGQSVNSPDVELFQSAFRIAQREGASLGPMLLRLAKVTRQRQSFRRRTRSALALQKLSSLGILGCAVVIVLFQFVTNPQALELVLRNELASFVFGAGVLVLIIGGGLMLRLVNQEIQ